MSASVNPPEGYGWCMECDGAEEWEYLKRTNGGGAKCAACRGAWDEYEG